MGGLCEVTYFSMGSVQGFLCLGGGVGGNVCTPVHAHPVRYCLKCNNLCTTVSV